MEVTFSGNKHFT